MVKGFGTDIVEVNRIEQILEKYGKHFRNRVFTSVEIDYCESKARPAMHYAGRWAVKEAFYKALPVECQQVSSWKSISVLSDKNVGKPEIFICSDELQGALEDVGITQFHVSISHEKRYCTASVLLE